MVSPVGDGAVEIQLDLVEQLVKEVVENKQLINLMRRYASEVRSPNSTATEEEDIAMRRQIFPYFQARLREIGKEYSIFSADIPEYIFQKIELGEI